MSDFQRNHPYLSAIADGIGFIAALAVSITFALMLSV